MTLQAPKKRYMTLDDLCDRVENDGKSRAITSSLTSTSPIRGSRKLLHEIASCPSRFPLAGEFCDMDRGGLSGSCFEHDILSLLEPTLSAERIDLFRSVAQKRIFSILPIIEGLVDYDNIGAVLRSAEGYGIGSVWAVGGNKIRALATSRCSAGAEKWIDTQVFRSTADCFKAAKKAGFRVAVAALDKDSVNIDELDWGETPTAFVLGNEGKGATEEALKLADVKIMIPMHGLVESFNVSVAAACIMQTAMKQIRTRQDRALTPTEVDILLTTMALRQDDLAGEVVRELVGRQSTGQNQQKGSISGFFATSHA